MSKGRVALLGGGASVLAKGIGFIAQLVALALISQRYSLESLGLFSVLTSFLLIYDFFDFGLMSGGMRYSMATEFSREPFIAAFSLSCRIYGILLLALPFVPGTWRIALGLILLRAPFLAVRHALCAEQKVYVRAFLEGLENLLAAGVVFFVRGPFWVLVTGYFGMLLLFSVGSFFLFLKKRGWRLEFFSVKEGLFYLRPLLRLSLFSWGQGIFLLLIIGSQPLLLSYCCSLEEVGRVAIIYKLFAMLFGVHYALLNPFLSMFTQASHRGERAWMAKVTRRFKWGFIPLFLGAVSALYLVYPVERSLFFALTLFAFSYMWGALFSVFLNGVARVERQVAFLGVAVAIHFLLSPYLAGIWGAAGFFLGEAVALLPFAFSNQREITRCVC